MNWIGPACPGCVGGMSPSAFAVTSKRSELAHAGRPSIWNGCTWKANRRSSRSGTFSAVKRPPGSIPKRMKSVARLVLLDGGHLERGRRRIRRPAGPWASRPGVAGWQALRRRRRRPAGRRFHTKPRFDGPAGQVRDSGYERNGRWFTRRFTPLPVRTIRHRPLAFGWRVSGPFPACAVRLMAWASRCGRSRSPAPPRWPAPAAGPSCSSSASGMLWNPASLRAEAAATAPAAISDRRRPKYSSDRSNGPWRPVRLTTSSPTAGANAAASTPRVRPS